MSLCSRFVAVAALFVSSPSWAATFIVNTTSDAPDATLNDVCATASGTCSLRAAVQEANRAATADVIQFNIPTSDGGCDANGVCVISVVTNTPQDVIEATQPVVIDGSTQPSNGGVCIGLISSRPTYRIVLEGDGNEPGLRLASGANNSTIRGLNLRGFNNAIAIVGANAVKVECNFIGTTESGTNTIAPNGSNGILIGCSSSDVSIGGADAGSGNLISDHPIDGIQIIGDGCPPAQPNNVFVRGNWIGTDKSGAIDLGNGFNGVSIFSATTAGMNDIYIGDKPTGLDAGANGNVLSGNDSGGVYISDRANNVFLVSNLIGTTALGNAALPNAFEGIFIEDYQCDGNDLPSNITIGSMTDTSKGNVISGNTAAGIYTFCSRDIDIGANVIGLGLDRTTAIPNKVGIELEYAQDTRIGNPTSPNVIAKNTREGVSMYGTGSFGVNLHANQMFENVTLGFDLGLDPGGPDGRNENDPGDLDNGPNRYQNSPEILERLFPPMTNIVTIFFRIDTDFDAMQSKRIDFFIADAPGEEGRVYLGSQVVTANGDANASFPNLGSNESSKFVATMTDLSNGSTSEFSLAFPRPIGIFSNGFEN